MVIFRLLIRCLGGDEEEIGGEEMLSVFNSLPFRIRLSSMSGAGPGGGGTVLVAATAIGRLIGQSNTETQMEESAAQHTKSVGPHSYNGSD